MKVVYDFFEVLCEFFSNITKTMRRMKEEKVENRLVVKKALSNGLRMKRRKLGQLKHWNLIIFLKMAFLVLSTFVRGY